MKKVFILQSIMFAFALTFTATAATKESNTNICIATSIDADYIDSVEAQDMYGRNTKYFSIWGERLANGRYYYYAKDNNGKYDIQYANNNKYKPFYVKIGDERWYFNSTELDRRSGTTNQW